MEDMPNIGILKLKLEEILPYVGEYGRFQHLSIAIVFTMNIPVVAQIMIVHFSVLTPTWRCALNSTICTFNGTLSPHDQRKCDIPREEWYFTEPKEHSLVTQFDIYCKDEWLLQLTKSIFFVGCALGAIILGWTAGRYGRKVILFSSVALMLVTGIVTSFMPHIYLIIACRFITGFFFPGAYIQAFLLISELLGAKHREGAGLYIFRVIPISWSLLALKAWLTKKWKVLSLISTAPYLFILLFYKFVPESLQWLDAYGKHDEIMTIARRIAFWNKKRLPENMEFVPSSNLSRYNVNTFDIFRTRQVALESLILIILWNAIEVVYHGLQLASNDLGESIYRDFVIIASISLPANFLAIYLCNKIGQKKSVLLSALGAGITCMTVVFIPPNCGLDALRVVIRFIGMLLHTVAYTVIHTWSAQLYPVTLRSQALGVFTASAQIGGTASQRMTEELKMSENCLPFMAVAAPIIIGAVIGIWLPKRYASDETEGNGVTDNAYQDAIHAT